jgi:hypothetical protein
LSDRSSKRYSLLQATQQQQQQQASKQQTHFNMTIRTADGCHMAADNRLLIIFILPHTKAVSM